MVLLAGVAPALAAGGPETAQTTPNVDPTVRCNPSSVRAPVGQTASLDLWVQDVTNLYGADLRVSFDPTIGQVQDYEQYVPGTQILPRYDWLSPGFIIHKETHTPTDVPPNCGVWCIWYAATQTNPTPPVQNQGPVATVTFLGLQVGTFQMNWINAQLSAPGGVPITPVNTQPCTVTFYNPLAVTLASFEAIPQPDHMLVAWETVSEINNRGFNLYRGNSAAGPEQQLNAQLIPSQASGSGQGYAYHWQDFDVTPGSTYYYWLETVSLSGQTQMHGPVHATMSAPTAVTLASLQATPAFPVVPPALAGLAALAALAGAALGARRR